MSFGSRDQTRGLPRPGEALAPYAAIAVAAGLYVLGRALPLRTAVALDAAAASGWLNM